jgi:hypothetical protein
MGMAGRIVDTDNHHMGLGLAKLVEGVERFKGVLWLASGQSMLNIRPDGSRHHVTLGIPWQGVALACRFDSARISNALSGPPADELESILARLMQG